LKKNALAIVFVAIVIASTLALYSFRNGGPGSSMKWKPGVALYSFNRFSFEEALDKADSINAEYVEGFFFHKLGDAFGGHSIPRLNEEEITKMKGMLDKRGLKMKSLYADGKNEDDWKANFEFAQKMKLEFLTAEPQKQHWDAIEKMAEHYKIKIAIHEHAKGSSYFWHPDSVVMAMQGRPHFRACADIGHWVRSGLDPVKCLQTLEGKIICLHIKDLDAAGNVKANDVMVGTGVIDYPAIVAELKRQHFDGYVYIEREGNWDKNIPDVDHALKYLDRLNR
jgi:sugar phosphate isomerase/epimerase